MATTKTIDDWATRPIYPRHPSDKPAPGTTVRIGDPGWSDPELAHWPEWDHPLGGPGRWAVVIRSLRKGVEACPLVEGVTLAPRPCVDLPLQSIENHRLNKHRSYERAEQAHEIARSSGLYTAEQLGEPPVYPAWLARGLPSTPADPTR